MKVNIIFSRYANNLKLLTDHGLIDRKPSENLIYICPICLREYNTLDDSSGRLTLEHVPPDALGGKANILTCDKCNSEAGYKIDAHLVNRLRELDQQQMTPGTEVRVTVKIGNEIFRGTIRVGENGTIEMEHSNKNNHPEKLAEAMKKLKSGTNLSADFIKSHVLPENIEYALLKTGYLLAFERCGYSIILHPCFDDVRAQILNPDKRIYPEGFWLTPPYPKKISGVYFITTKGLEALLSIFNVNTGKSERLFATILPLPIRPVKEVIETLNEQVEKKDQLEISLYPKQQGTSSYIDDVENIRAMKNWIKNRTPV